MKPKRGIGLLVIALCIAGAGVIISQASNYASTKTAQEQADPGGGSAPTNLKMTPATKAERTAAIKSIVSQLEAFKRDDYQEASNYQASGLRRNFTSIQNFRKMMLMSYPEFAHYKSASFGDATADPSGTYVNVPIRLTGEDGITVNAFYEMILEGGAYRVVAVGGGYRPMRLNRPDVRLT